MTCAYMYPPVRKVFEERLMLAETALHHSEIPAPSC